MKRFLLVLLLATAPVRQSQTPISNSGSDFASTLNFETQHTGTTPRGWGGGPPETIFVDGNIVHSGRWAVRLERNSASPQEFTTITRMLPADFAGKTIEWRGFLRTEDVSEFTGLWLREDGDTPGLAFDNMQQQHLNGTQDWKEYSIRLPLHPDAKQIFFGVLTAGTGKAWADDLQLLVDGKPVWEAPKAERPQTVIDLDHEFDAGSGIALRELSKTQVDNLVVLGKVWGFLKYHHPAVIAGKLQWDYELFRVLPKIVAAADRNAANVAVYDWVRGLGEIPDCGRCTALRTDDIHLRPEVDWIDQDAVLGLDLARLLRNIYKSRTQSPQFYVSMTPGVGNPKFEHEPAYAGMKFPDAGYQLLALYRFWNIIEYWYPNRNIVDQDWSSVLAEFIPRIALAKNREDYQLEMIALIAKVTDTHANLWSAPPQSRPPVGSCQLPVVTRFLESRAVVTGYSEATAGPATGFKVGDVIESFDGTPIPELVNRWIPYYPASNQAARLRDIGRALTRGDCSSVRVSVRREDQVVTVSAQRIPLTSLNRTADSTHDLAGETFRLLSKDVAYLKLSSVKSAQVGDNINGAKGTKGIVIDIRNYPSEFVVFTLGSLLQERTTAFVRFTFGDLQNPGAFHWGESLMLTPAQPHYQGKVVILVDEVSQSQAEYTAMAFRSSPQATVIGSTTAGADGNVSEIPIPGGHRTMISGIGVFYPDKKPTQRVGIIPDIEVKPTLAGIRAGRDEVLEEALRRILGAQTPQTELEKLYKIQN
jgi:C-terminal processing protease CtpA/Prc